ncbi:unnamed protein product [Prunus armeniaca]|uniref:Uncharacterized protein n=1 Tax=Prunus armeniaca TaxID=36596 RepID=A0A6J5UHE9_PRUAR|nr:unnamed protein product [Prunus armeniaca]
MFAVTSERMLTLAGYIDAKTDAGVVDVGLVLDKHNMQKDWLPVPQLTRNPSLILYFKTAFSSRKIQAISDDFDGKEEATRSLSSFVNVFCNLSYTWVCLVKRQMK